MKQFKIVSVFLKHNHLFIYFPIKKKARNIVLAIHGINDVPVKMQPMAKQSQQISFGNSLNKDTFTSSKSQVAQSNVSFGGLIPQFLKDLISKSEPETLTDKKILDETIEAIFNEEYLSEEPMRVLINCVMIDADSAYVKEKLLDKIVKANARGSIEELDKYTNQIVKLGLVDQVIKTDYLYKNEKKKPVGYIDVEYAHAVDCLLDTTNPLLKETKQQIETLKDTTNDYMLISYCRKLLGTY